MKIFAACQLDDGGNWIDEIADMGERDQLLFCYNDEMLGKHEFHPNKAVVIYQICLCSSLKI